MFENIKIISSENFHPISCKVENIETNTVIFAFIYSLLILIHILQVNVSSLIPGTTCATVLTQAILTEGCKSIAAGINVMDLRNGINKAVDAVITELKRRALMISTSEEITQVQGLLKKLFLC